MENFLKLLQKNALPNEKKLGGFFIGEKVLYCASKRKLVYLCADFVTASKLKKGLSDCGRRVQIVSCGRENEDEKDINLFPFARSISDFLNDHLDVLIFLPSSITTKFDLDFLDEKIRLETGREFPIEKLLASLTDFGFERVDYVTSVGQFAVRGDIVDIFAGGQEFPYRIEYFDDEIEKMILFDFSNMKTQEIVKKVAISPLFLRFGANSVFDLCENVVVDEPLKIENE